MGIKNNLYSVLNDFGKESIQIEFQNNINSSIPKIKEILSKTIETIYQKNLMGEMFMISISTKNYYLLLCEAFLHFLLTTSSFLRRGKLC